MAGELEAVLKRLGPCLSGAAATAMGETYGISLATARQRIARRVPPVASLDLPFPRNASFLYLKKDYGADRFWAALANALLESNGAYARVIWALRARGGIIPVSHLGAAAGTSDGARQLSRDVVQDRLVKAGLLELLEVPAVGMCVAFAKTGAFLEGPTALMQARLLTEAVLLGAVKDWAAKLGLGSFNRFELRGGDKPPRISNFEFDMTAPSYLGPLAGWESTASAPKPGFVVFDILLGTVVTESAVKPFVHKCLSLRRLKKVGRCLQFFIANRYTPEALTLLKKHGIVPATSESLFGREVAEALVSLLDTLSRAANAAVDPVRFEELFSKLGRLEGAAGTLRGALFEFTAAEIARKTFGGAQISMNKIYRKNGKDAAEVDIRAVLEHKCIYFIECKGLLPGSVLDDGEVEKWLTKRIPVVKEQTLANQDMSKLELKFELWTTGELTSVAKARIATLQERLRPNTYTVQVRFADDLEKLARDSGDESLLKVLRQHFLQHPLAEADASNVPDSSQKEQVIHSMPTPGQLAVDSSEPLPK